jgi:flavin-dependent dehydrogenase
VESKFDAKKMFMWWHEPYAPFGYAWLFPINNRLANIGIGIPGRDNINIKNLLNKYINFMTNGDYKITKTFGACEPMTKPLDKLVENNIIFVGDAARLVDPASGAGIHNSVFSGALAGLIAADYINGKISSLDIFQDLMKNKINRIRRTYNNKIKLNTGDKFVKGFNRVFATISMLNKLFPNFYQGYIAKILNKDLKIIDLYK